MQRLPDGVQHCLRVAENLVVPGAEDPEALAVQPSTTPVVVNGSRCVLRAVDFNDQPACEADEIDDVWAYRLLPFEFPAREAARAQVAPEECFRLGSFAAHPASETQQSRFRC